MEPLRDQNDVDFLLGWGDDRRQVRELSESSQTAKTKVNQQITDQYAANSDYELGILIIIPTLPHLVIHPRLLQAASRSYQATNIILSVQSLRLSAKLN